ncbi:universal stress protein [Streptomyces sp. SID6673]|nr:universal stress protein [Streptomyces sp. SID11726]NDZ94728.1 universal stress protein [Streptomyces sp. SID11726]NEB22888.1 universal stress protein [Streptomyces sp. SID6673]
MRLLVAYLATTGGADAISVGVRLARTLGARLDVCMVVPRDRTAPLLPAANYDEVLVEQSEQWLTEALDLVPTDVAVTTHVVLHDSAAQGLLDETERLGAAALVVGGSGGGMAGSHSLGSVVNELLHASSVPVVLAPRGARHSAADRVREITCAIGTLPGSTELLDAAVRVSAEGSLPLRLVSLVGLDKSGDASRLRRATAHAEETLDKAVAALPPATSVTACVAEGTSVESAVDSLDWRDGDLIMVGSSRLAQPRRLFLGSTAAKMLRVLAVPMVVVPRHDG